MSAGHALRLTSIPRRGWARSTATGTRPGCSTRNPDGAVILATLLEGPAADALDLASRSLVELVLGRTGRGSCPRGPSRRSGAGGSTRHEDAWPGPHAARSASLTHSCGSTSCSRNGAWRPPGGPSSRARGTRWWRYSHLARRLPAMPRNARRSPEHRWTTVVASRKARRRGEAIRLLRSLRRHSVWGPRAIADLDAQSARPLRRPRTRQGGAWRRVLQYRARRGSAVPPGRDRRTRRPVRHEALRRHAREAGRSSLLSRADRQTRRPGGPGRPEGVHAPRQGALGQTPLAQQDRASTSACSTASPTREEMLRAETDPEMKELAKDELDELEAHVPSLEDELKVMMLPERPERRQERHRRDPRGRRRRRGRAVRGRSLPHVHALRRVAALEGRGDRLERERESAASRTSPS